MTILSPLHLHKPNKGDATRDKHNYITTNGSLAETPYTSFLGVVRDPQCEVRHHISPSLSSNKVLTAKKSSQMARMPFSFNDEK